MIPYFRDLGERIGAAWRATGHDERVFARLATDALCDARPDRHVTIDDVARWVLDPARSLAQPEMSPFGQPPVLVYGAERFRIEALFWRDSTTSIHQHSFAGAFAPLGGSSFHSTYEFAETARINTRFRIGRLRTCTAEILRPGDVRAIEPGGAFIHQVTHLEVPTVTVVARTRGFLEYRPQLRYELPGIALDDDEVEPDLARRLAMIDLLAATRRDDALDVAHRWIRAGDLESVYHVLAQLAPHVTEPELRHLAAALRERQGALGDVIAAACQHRRRVHSAITVRARSRSPRIRLVVAMLMLGLPDAELRPLLDAYAAGALDDAILELARTGLLGVSDDELTQDMIRALVRGATPDTLLPALAEDYDADELAARHDDLVEHAQRICGVPLLAHLFADRGWAAPPSPRAIP